MPKSCFRATSATVTGKLGDGTKREYELVMSALSDKQCKAQLKLKEKYQGKLRRYRPDAYDSDSDDEIEKDEDEDEVSKYYEAGDINADDEEEDALEDAEHAEDADDEEISFKDRLAMWREIDHQVAASDEE
eukprot:gnl/TRDRNA2_/TRDRNA2_169213_c2_seq1.p1 gnl/TRDRNA2_/TRDRNA2_169213_c2~~gnl/TRDRNA2_/TRDRNA2_169213_c2_seq1.p1  ORF type:complete len:132 (+),score=44.41 gnl/TRDRNA2_/TRDRNA2_169213_c2_seq1:62-457(+)